MSTYMLGEELCVKSQALSMFGADELVVTKGLTLQSPEHYARIDRTAAVELLVARADPFSKQKYFHDAVSKAVAKYPWVTGLDYWEIAAEQETPISLFGITGGTRINRFVLKRVTANYLPWTEYINSLGYETDAKAFLKRLLLHESAGLCIGRRMKNIVYDMSSLLSNPAVDPVKPPTKLTADVLAYAGHKGTFQGSDRWGFKAYNPMRNLKDDAFKLKEDIIDVPTVESYRYPEYKGADHAKIASFLIELSRFRERCLPLFLGQTFQLLDTAKLTDQETVETMYQHFTRSPMEILGLINQTVDRQVTTSGNLKNVYPGVGRELFDWMVEQTGTGGSKTVNDPISWDQFNGIRLYFKGNSGKEFLLSIPEYLQVQFEAAAWVLLCNWNKLEGRIAQLRDNTAQLMAQAPIPWIMDPWENPFLMYDEEMSAKLDKAMYVNKAKSNAQQPPELQRAVASVTVPQFYMKQAPEIRKKLRRTTMLPGGASVSLDELEKGQGFAPGILAAAAAIAIGYLATR